MKFTFEGVVSEVSSSGKRIVRDVSGECNAGSTLAILGPSGAGKTSLLNLLTLNPTGYSLRAFLTCRETVRYTIDFYEASLTDEQKDEMCDKLLNKLGLSSCADVKRLSVAVALCRKPNVLFLDEPTSGLDAGSAEGITSLIKELAGSFNIVVILTVHQPSSRIYFGFDRVLLMSQGRTTYFGTPAGSVEHFASIGYKCPELANPADYLLGVINQEFCEGGEVAVDKILAAWEAKSTEEEDTPNALRQVPVQLLWWEEFQYVLRRQMKIVMADPMVYIGRGVGFILITLFFAVIYIDARARAQDQLMNRLFFLMWLMGVPTCMGVVAVYVLNEEMKIVEKEVRNGMYRLSSFLVSSFLIQIPACFLLAVCATGISGFAVLDLWAPNFFGIVGMYALMLFAFECIARCMLGYMNVWFISFLFSGIMVPEDQIIWPFRVLVWLLPLNWGMSAIAYLDISDTTNDGAFLCTKEIWPGWTCSEEPGGEYNPTQCLGYLGTQALDSIGITFESISSENNVGRNCIYNSIIALCVWFIYVLIAYRKIMRESAIRPSTELSDAKNVASTSPKGEFELVSINENDNV
eukprot:GSChrysophyteH1.ASY1.ANO1.2013.1 assembled CDS